MSGLENAALLALVAVVPLVVLTLTSFVKLSVVLSLLRNAIGAPDAPSGLVITGLSLVLTFFVMAPVAVPMVQAAGSAPAPAQRTQPVPAPAQRTRPVPAPAQPAPGPAQPAPGPVQPAPGPAQPVPGPAQPAPAPAPHTPGTPMPQGTAMTPGTTTPLGAPMPSDGASSPAAGAAARDAATPAGPSFAEALRAVVPAPYQPQLAAAERAVEPLRAFLARHTRDADRETFASLARKLGNVSSGDELWVLAPAFITTELREAFVIAILIFIPFLVIDLVVGLSLASLGLQATSPQTVALPLKLVLFVAVDGWRLLIDALLRGYA